jgi:hypothetical protein
MESLRMRVGGHFLQVKWGFDRKVFGVGQTTLLPVRLKSCRCSESRLQTTAR